MRFTVPVGRMFPLAEVHDAARLGRTGRPGGKVVLLMSADALAATSTC